MRKNIVAIVVAVAAAGCAGAPATNPADLKLWKTVRLPAASTGAFSACLLSGFGKAHPVTHTTVRERRGEGVTRVETWDASKGLQVSALVFDDGRIEFRESPDPLVDSSKERAVFLACFDVQAPR